MDIDIDLPTTFKPEDYFDVTLASMVKNGELKKHPVGAYFQNIPKDKLTNLSAIPYKDAEELGYFKIDFLHLTILDNFDNKDEIRQLLKIEPDWSILQNQTMVEKLFQIHKHYDILQKVKPTSVIELSDCIALIRPAKRNLINKYLLDKEGTREELYRKPADGGYYFKKSHSISYALTIVLQLHLIKGGII